MRRLKPFMLPISMLGGILFYPWMYHFTFLSPYLIFMMLVITYSRVEPREFRIGKMQWILLAAQLVLSAAVFFSLVWWNKDLASGVFVCVFIPTATAAPVITAMLGGSITRLVGFSLIGNLSCAILGPGVLAAMGVHPDMTFMESFSLISSRVFPLLVLPIIVALILRYSWRRAHDFMAQNQDFSFYMWAVSLFIVVGSSVSFLIRNYRHEQLPLILWLAAGSLLACLLQFKIGRYIGSKFGDKISGGQGLGQKNTVLAIWIALTYLHPITSLAPACYVGWQNIINSWQIMRHKENALK